MSIRPTDRQKSDYDARRPCRSPVGVRHARPHDGRHTAATMELLWHSKMRTTLEIYSHVMPALAREARRSAGTDTPDGAIRVWGFVVS
jgi:integrase